MQTKEYYKYAQDVISGEVVAGKYIRLAAERFFNMMEDERYEFREDKADDVIGFFSILKHFTGRHAGKPFVLQPWQQFVIAAIYGFYVRESGERLVQNAYIEISRKNGKTAFAAGICLYHLIADDEMDAEVDLAANSKEQAKIAFKFCSQFAKGIDPKGRDLIIYRDKVKFDKMLSLLQVFAADDSKLDGYNASMYLIDEYHAAKNSRLKDVLETSQSMRMNPMGIIITTAGFDKLGPCYQHRTMCTEVLTGLKTDDTLFAAIFSIDEGDNWKDENVWIKSNPNLNVTVRIPNLRNKLQSVENNPSNEVNIKTKTFNIWCDAETVWIPDTYLLDASKKLKLEQFSGKSCWMGVDLSSTSDLTAIAFMIPDEYKYHFIARYYLPEAALREKRFKDLYGKWRMEKMITITPGNVTDYDYILNDILEAQRYVNIEKIAYDTWNATQFTINAEEKGLPMEPYSQVIGNFNRPTREMERMLLSGNAIIDNNTINRHCFRNVVMARDRNGNVKPTKQFEEKKIDGVIAMLEALGVYLNSPHYGEFY